MSKTNEALRRLVVQIGLGKDVLLGGTPVQARQLLAEAGVTLAGQATVVSVASPIGELSLSTLIAQLSGRLDFDDQDDAVLELGFKRLTGDGNTVLMLLAPAGISRSALRYLQHVARQAPGLLMAVYRAPSLAAVLEEPGFAALRTRLYASPAVEFDAPAEVAATRSVAVLRPVHASVPAPLFRVGAARARRPVLWAALALSVAAIAGVVWFVENTPSTAMAGSRTAQAGIPLVAATVPLPKLAGSATVLAANLPPTGVAAAAASPSLADCSLSATATLPPIAPATLPSQPLPYPETIVTGLAQPQPRAERTARRPESTRREPSRFARPRPYWPAPRYQEPGDYQSAQSWDGVSPVWVRRDPRRREPPYLGTYGVDSNGVRVFEYDR